DRVREREVVDRLAHRARGDVDHPTVSAPLELGKAEPRQADGRDQEQLDRLLDLLVGQTGGGRPRRAAAVVDEDVDAAEGLEGAVNEPLEVGGVGEVAAYSEAADALRFAGEQVAPAREHRDVRALGGECFRYREAHPRGGPADDR